MNANTSICSPASAASPSQPRQTELKPSSNAKQMSLSPKASRKLGDFQLSETFENSKAGNGSDPGCLPLVFHASQLLEPATRQARMMTAGSGQKLCVLLKTQSPLGRCLKILLVSMMWDSAESLLKWRGSATRSLLPLFRLVPLIRHRTAKDIGSSQGDLKLWPAAVANDARGHVQVYGPGVTGTTLPGLLKGIWPCAQYRDRKGISQKFAGRLKGTDKTTGGVPLPNELKMSLWPAAQAHDRKVAVNTQSRERMIDKTGAGCWNLSEHLKASLWPTAKASASGPDYARVNRPEQAGDDLATPLARGLTHNGCLIRPGGEPLKFAALQLAFTAWQMGYPLDYLKAWVPDSSGPSVTRSAGRSRRKSSAQ